MHYTRMPADGRGRMSGMLAWPLLACALAVGLAVHMADAKLMPMRAVETTVRDGLVKGLARADPDLRIALVDIDEASLRSVGAWPWPRSRLADLAESLLSTQQAALVVFDLVLPEPSVGAEAEGDARLAALGREGLLVPAQAFDYVRRSPPVTAGVAGGALAVAGALRVPAATGHVANFDGLSQARCVGNIGFTPDFDGKVRRLAPLIQWQGNQFPMLALAAIQCSRGTDALQSLLTTTRIDADGYWDIPFSRSPESYLAVPAVTVIKGETIPSLAGRIVLVGSSALGLADRVATPVSPSTAGVTVHAAALSSLLDSIDGHVMPVPPASLALAWLALSSTALWWSIAFGQRLRAIAAVLIAGLSGWALLSIWSVVAGFARPVTSALWSYGSLMGLYLPLEWSAAQARVRSRTRLLTRYLAKPVVEELLRTERSNPLVARHAEISVLIADMQDYTRITAHSTLEEAATLTRQFLDCLTQPVLTGRGTLDSYTGDGMVAFWGAPIATAEHADHALRAALEIHRNVAGFNTDRREHGLFPVRVRIGVATGRALVGDLGTPFRSTYTAIGDVVNLAARLQQAARDMSCDILVSAGTAEAVGGQGLRSIGRLSLHGLQSVEVFTPNETPDAGQPLNSPDRALPNVSW